MKKILTLLAAMVAAVGLCVQPFFSNTQLDYSSTNTITIDCSGAATVAIQAAFTGSGARGNIGNFTFTNSAMGSTNGQLLTVEFNGTNTVYTFTNTPVTSVTNTSVPYTNAIIGGFVLPATGDSVTINLNADTFTLYFTNDTSSSSYAVLTNAVAGVAITNLYTKFLEVFPKRTVTQDGTNTITLTGLTTDALLITNSATWATNQRALGAYTVTNVYTTNLYHIQSHGSPKNTATNVYNKLSVDFASTLAVTQASETNILLTVLAGQTLRVTNDAALGTNYNTTNAIIGSVNFVATESLDGATYIANAAKNFSVAYNGTTAVGIVTNFATPGGSGGFLRYTIGNAGTNYAEALNLRFIAIPR